MFLLNLPDEYKVAGCLTGHREAILCLAVSLAGDLLASGGFDGLRVWDIQRMVQLAKPTQMRNPGDPITSLMWLSRRDNSETILCSGSGLGYLMLWRQRSDSTEFQEIFSRRIGTGQEIMSMNQYNIDGGTRIIMGTRNRHAQLWVLDSKLNISNLFSVELAHSVPRAMYFHGANIVTLGMYDGEM
ncbi:WD40-repeat-containing domain protein [Boletus reticuloceps]|uniref:WD40-repeat-containing domain protein n=1 Tax=Boletus reticuloceps TaxID=495285 RepID=A0A8I2YDZ9_9AGAM|nr:WD40-repeat-containing domain protein [Boletus reticuloceps]